MEREEAIAIIERMKHTESKWPGTEDTLAALDLALTALRGSTREMVEKIKKEPEEGSYDEWWCPAYICPECGWENPGKGNFCQRCGCPFTDESVDMMLKRWKEAVDDEVQKEASCN